jgi:hypothetical protein
MNTDGANRPDGTRPVLPTLATVQRWPGANPPRWLCPRWAAIEIAGKKMKHNIVIGLGLGIIAGILDVIPMVLQGLTWDANLSAFFLWVVSGFMLATSNLKLHSVPKGIVIAFLCLLPSVFIIGWNDPFSLVPIGVMTFILGALLGFAYGKLSK